MLKLSVENLCSGGMIERLSQEVEKAISNCLDPNTEWKKPRVVNLKMTIVPNEERDMADLSVLVESKLCPAKALTADLFIGCDIATGEVDARERVKDETPSFNPEAFAQKDAFIDAKLN